MMKMNVLVAIFALLLLFGTGCTTTTTRRVLSAQGGGKGELWVVVTRNRVENRLFMKVADLPTYEVYYCTPTGGCKKVGELKKIDVQQNTSRRNLNVPHALAKKGIVLPFKSKVLSNR